MHKLARRTTRDQLKRDPQQPPSGVEPVVTGGPMRKLDLTEVLARGGAVPGAAHIVLSSLDESAGERGGIALSDGSRISFASVADPRVMREDTPPPVPGGKVLTPA